MTPSERALIRIADLWDIALTDSDYVDFHISVGDVLFAMGLLKPEDI